MIRPISFGASATSMRVGGAARQDARDIWRHFERLSPGKPAAIVEIQRDGRVVPDEGQNPLPDSRFGVVTGDDVAMMQAVRSKGRDALMGIQPFDRV